MLETLAIRTRLRSVIRRTLSRSSIVLCYHRIADVPHDPERLAVSPRHFAEHMEVVSRRRRCTVDGLTGVRSRSRGSILVTLDDAYRDNLLNAWPILQRYDVPAVIFAPSTLCARGEPFWWEVMRRLFFSDSNVPTEALEALCARLEAMDGARKKRDAAAPSEEPRDLFLRCQKLVRLGDDSLRRCFVAEGMTLLGVPVLADDTWPMSPEELRRISEDGLIEIGGHTRTHVQLSALSRAEQHDEIAGGKAELETMLERPVRCFAYPYGSPTTDFNTCSVEVAREAGFLAGFVFLPALVDDACDPMLYGRFRVDNYGGDELARQLVLWFGRPQNHLPAASENTRET
jgi:peptidoglycan/xylan/chitin deacetylase (PgdA/CDA1 family)